MIDLKSRTTQIVGGALLALGLTTYGFFSTRNHLEERIASLESELQAVRTQDATRVQQIANDLNYVAEKMDVTKKDLEDARKLSESLKQENAAASQRFKTQLASNNKAVDRLRAESASKLDAVQQD